MWIDFKITNRCNNNCVYCGVSHDGINTEELLPMYTVVDTVKSALNVGFNKFSFLGVSLLLGKM